MYSYSNTVTIIVLCVFKSTMLSVLDSVCSHFDKTSHYCNEDWDFATMAFHGAIDVQRETIVLLQSK